MKQNFELVSDIAEIQGSLANFSGDTKSRQYTQLVNSLTQLTADKQDTAISIDTAKKVLYDAQRDQVDPVQASENLSIFLDTYGKR